MYRLFTKIYSKIFSGVVVVVVKFYIEELGGFSVKRNMSGMSEGMRLRLFYGHKTAVLIYRFKDGKLMN